MPVTEQLKQTIGHEGTDAQKPAATATRKPAAKAAGTRMGIFQDWREGSTTGKARRQCQTLRDGR
jgi:hypothetical protein